MSESCKRSTSINSLTAQDILTIFNRAFMQNFHTRIEGGRNEPFYQARKRNDNGENVATIYFSHDYPSSALHEIAHWCVAGEKRREKDDYGYWYNPDGRNEQEQKQFELVEVKPQALEWIFSKAAGIKFFVSADNLLLNCGASDTFKRDIHKQVIKFLEKGLPKRASIFLDCLLEMHKQPMKIRPKMFCISELN